MIADTMTTRYRHIDADGVRLFYREAGDPASPTLLLLHGFPTSSHMFRTLMPELAGSYHLVAPDFPGFGFTEVPADRQYVYTFDAIARTIDAFVDALGLTRYGLYVFDYGAPVGWRHAVRHPQRIAAIVSQNGNAYVEGLGPAWAPIRDYWRNPDPAHRDAIRSVLTLPGISAKYLHGSEEALIAPEAYLLDYLLMQRAGNDEIQLDLFFDYANNLTQYADAQAYFRASQVPTLAIWGKYDRSFVPAGAEAFARDNANASVELLEAGHFAIETHARHIARRIDEVLGAALRCKT
jgi:pimeloyl-ACP methyl ester carboxylesterase